LPINALFVTNYKNRYYFGNAKLKKQKIFSIQRICQQFSKKVFKIFVCMIINAIFATENNRSNRGRKMENAKNNS